jgi:hypothetical protein
VLKKKWVERGGRCDLKVNELNTLANTINISPLTKFLTSVGG